MPRFGGGIVPDRGARRREASPERALQAPRCGGLAAGRTLSPGQIQADRGTRGDPRGCFRVGTRERSASCPWGSLGTRWSVGVIRCAVMRSYPAWWAVGLLAVGACARRGPETVLDRIEQEPQVLVAQVAALRQLSAQRLPRLVFHDASDFSALVKEEVLTSQSAADDSEQTALDQAFGLSHAQGAAGVTPDELLAEQIVAFYDDETHTIHVRRQEGAGPEREQEALWALVHEIGHALQFENLPVPDLDAIDNEDAWLAAMALLEGDAMVTMLAYAAHERRIPLRRVLVQVKRRVERGRFDEAMRISTTSPVLARAPAIVRERLVFPYSYGALFIGALHRAGGFPLVNRAFQRPPLSTEHVLHPEKYLAGEIPVAVPPPPAPAGYELMHAGRMGELQTRVILGNCVGEPVAWSAAAGWGGDAFSLLKDAEHTGVMIWNTAWDSERDAIEFESAARATGECWDAKGGRDAQSLVYRQGSRVAVTRGLPSRLATSVVEGVLSMPLATSPPAPPLGLVTIPPIKPRVTTRPPSIVLGAYVDERLGIRLPIPSAYGARVEDEVFVMVRRSQPPASGSISVSDWTVNADNVEQLFQEFAEAFQGAGDDAGQLVTVETTAVELPLGKATARTWDIEGTPGKLRLLILPLCHRTGSVAFSQLWYDDTGRAELGHWLAGLEPLAKGPPPICAELDP